MVDPVSGAIIGSAVIGGVSSLMGGRAAAKAQANQLEWERDKYWFDYEKANMAASSMLNTGREQSGKIGRAYDQAYDLMDQSFGDANSRYRQGMSSAIGDIQANGQRALGALEPTRQLLNYSGMAGSQSGFRSVDNQQFATEGLMRSGALNGTSALEGLTGPNAMQNFQQSPGYQFSLQQAQKGLANQQAARGGRASGRAMQELAALNQGMASQEYNNYMQQQMALGGQLDQFRQNQISQQLSAAGQLDVNRQRGMLSQAEMELQAGEGARGRAASMVGMGATATGQTADIYSNLGRDVANTRMQGTTYLSNLGVQRGEALGNNRIGGVGAQTNVLTGTERDAYSLFVGGTANSGVGQVYGGMADTAANTWQNVGATVQNATSNYAAYAAYRRGGGTPDPQYQPSLTVPMP